MTAPVLQFKRGLLANLPGLRAGEPGFTTDSYDLYVGIDSTTTNNKFFGSHRYWTRGTASTGSGVNFVEGTSNGTSYITLKAADSLAGITTFTLPSADGTTGQVIVTNGSGSLSFTDISTNLRIAGGAGTDTVSLLTDTLTFAGTANEIETTVTNNQVQIGLPDNVTIANNFKVTGVSTFVGAVTFEGGTITLGDAATDNVVFAADVNSNIVPNTDASYDFGTASQRWRNANFSGVVTATTFSGNASSADQVKTVTASNNSANYYVTFVDTHNGSATNETVYTDDGIYYNPGTNTFTTQYGYFTGSIGVGTAAPASGLDVVGGEIRAGRIDSSNEGGQISFSRALDNATAWYIDVFGNTSTPNLRFVDATSSTVRAILDGSGNFLLGTGSATGTASQPLQVSGGAYVSGNIGVGITLPTSKLHVSGDALVTGVVTATTFIGALTGTASTATRATLVDTTSTSANSDYYVTFVDTLAGQNGETLRVGAGLSVNPSDGSVKTAGTLSVGNAGALTSYIKSGGGSNAMYLYANGDVSFQSKIIAAQIRSNDNSNALITLSGLNATFAQDIAVTGITTTGTLKLAGTSGIGITGISASTSLAENSNNYLPTQAAVKAYVDAVDLTTGIAGDTGTGTVNTSQTLTIAGTANQVATSASGQTVTVSLPSTVIVGTALSAPTVRTATLQHQNGTQAATIDTSGNITAAQNLTISGNLYVNGSTTQVNTASMTVEDRTIELGIVDGSAPSSTTTWDLGVLFNYYDGSAKKSALIWEQGDARFKLGSVVADGGGTGNSNPQITFTTYAPLEIGGLWVNDCAGQSQVIACSGSTRTLENITIDGGAF